MRFDIQNPFKRPNFSNPVAVTNLSNPGTFGKPTATVGSWSGLGGSFLGTLGIKALVLAKTAGRGAKAHVVLRGLSAGPVLGTIVLHLAGVTLRVVYIDLE